MKRSALLFVLAVFLPSLVLAWLAVRSLRDQQFVLERQQALLCQNVADALAKEAETFLTERQREFAAQVETLLAAGPPGEVARGFDDSLRQAWPLADVGFVVKLPGELLTPTPWGRPEARSFCIANGKFLGNRESIEVYWNTPKGAINLSRLEDKGAAPREEPPGGSAGQQAVSGAVNPSQSQQLAQIKNPANLKRNVNLQQQFNLANPKDAPPADAEPLSKVTAAEAGFRQLIGESAEGAFARFLDNRLRVMFWYRPPRDPQLVFGAQLDLARLTRELQGLVRVEAALQPEIVAALLDDAARPVAVSRPGFQPASWKRPFVATEIGEALPHWEMAVYLLDPGRLGQSARALTFTLSLLVAVLLVAIVVGGALIMADAQRQMLLARQKTDFVSNVSHELKTPLTSIRMFTELLAEGRVTDAAKQRSYLQIISAETARLTRLINNVLDFARLERGEQRFSLAPCDLVALVRETVAAYRPQLEAGGFQLHSELPSAPVPVQVDRDALAQVLVNLLSNAEKYSGDRKEITVQVGADAAVRVLDRGGGVPRGSEERIFEQFHRAHDSLASGIPGSGLGLTLARQIARAHGGDVTHAPRDGGGSCFTLRLPARKENHE